MSSIIVRSRAGRRGSVLVATSLLLLATGEARSDEGDRGGSGEAIESEDAPPRSWLHGWSPLVDVEFAIHAQELKAEGETTFGARDSGSNTVSTLLARLETGFVTPAVSAIPGSPNLVVRGGGSFSLRETSTILSTQRLEGGVELGADFSTSWKDMWHAGLDLRFRLPIAGREIVIEPGIEYLQSRFRFEPLFSFRAQPGSPEAQGFPNPFNPPTLDFRGRSGSDVHRFVGPSLAIRSELIRVGPLGLSAHLQGRMYFLLGDRDTAVAFSAPLLGQTESAVARMESNALAGQVGFGIRGSF